MGEPATKRFTYAEYLEQEQQSLEKHEFLDGKIFAMAGGTPVHAFVITGLSAEIRSALRRGPCTVYSSDLRIRVLETGLATYPDVTVICGKPRWAPEDQDAATNPTVLVEVLSPSTEAYDRGDKWIHYQKIPSLREYVLVTPASRRVELYSRGEGGTWSYREVRDAELVLASVDCKVPLADVFDKLDLVRPEPAS